MSVTSSGEFSDKTKLRVTKTKKRI